MTVVIMMTMLMVSVKVTVMDRLVAELAGIETALVSLQDQVGQTCLHICNYKLDVNISFTCANINF